MLLVTTYSVCICDGKTTRSTRLPGDLRMNTLSRFSVALLLMLSCSCTPAAPLNSNECEKLLKKITQIMSTKLKGKQRKQFLAESVTTKSDVEHCVREKNWNREGYDCVMEADTPRALDACILFSN